MFQISLPVRRRSFLTRMGAAASVIGAGTVGLLPARTSAATAEYRPARHAIDDWMDSPTGVHRMVIDSSSADGGGAALLYAGNFLIANKAAYNLDAPAIAVIVVLRHFSTPFAFKDAIWAKYGTTFSELANFKDPKSGAAPTTNVYDADGYGTTLTNFGNTISSLAQKNVQFAVCNMAMQFVSGAIADKTKGNADIIHQELASNLIPNAHVVAAGVLATNRAQERGYTLLYAG